jgi:murein DD-endopeptidase MepM/ murein hydrolase activator NlpD
VPPPVPARPPRTSLLAPTAKVLLAVLLTTAVAGGTGAALGLPLPLTSSGHGGNVASAAAVPANSSAAGAGPYFPVAGPVDYGNGEDDFGPRSSGFHPGQDMLTKAGTPLIAVRSGTIVDAGTVNGRYSGGRGNYLYLWAPQDKRTYVYEHMQHPSPLHVGDSVVAGEYVGRVGCTGDCQGPHLHFEVRLGLDDFGHDPKPIDPLPLLRTWARPPQEAITGSPDKRLAP